MNKGNGDTKTRERRGGRITHNSDYAKLHFRLCFNAFMSIIWPLFTIPLHFVHTFSNIFTSIRCTDAQTPFPLVISKNVFIYVNNNSFTDSIPALSRSAALSFLFFYFIPFHWRSNICRICWRYFRIEHSFCSIFLAHSLDQLIVGDY